MKKLQNGQFISLQDHCLGCTGMSADNKRCFAIMNICYSYVYRCNLSKHNVLFRLLLIFKSIVKSLVNNHNKFFQGYYSFIAVAVLGFMLHIRSECNKYWIFGQFG